MGDRPHLLGSCRYCPCGQGGCHRAVHLVLRPHRLPGQEGILQQVAAAGPSMARHEQLRRDVLAIGAGCLSVQGRGRRAYGQHRPSCGIVLDCDLGKLLEGLADHARDGRGAAHRHARPGDGNRRPAVPRRRPRRALHLGGRHCRGRHPDDSHRGRVQRAAAHLAGVQREANAGGGAGRHHGCRARILHRRRHGGGLFRHVHWLLRRLLVGALGLRGTVLGQRPALRHVQDGRQHLVHHVHRALGLHDGFGHHGSWDGCHFGGPRGSRSPLRSHRRAAAH
mmetsp:Transcript_115707/g.367934  ORF Transcript_115707/g.367934 Transcript_115707/m.367934 type:complete len:280 (+) Transcript_115707:392-1231(+)